MSRYRYRHHGFTISTNEPLERLGPAPPDSPADISVEALPAGSLTGQDRSWVMTDPPVMMWRSATGDGSFLRLRYAAGSEWSEFIIDERGETVWVCREQDIAFAEVAELLLGPVFSCVLAQRGLTCLHGACVRIAGRVVVVVGPSGIGKSTTAAGLVRRGGTLIADDVAVVRIGEEAGPSVLAGAPRIRMREDAAERLIGSFAGLDEMWQREENRPRKRYLELEGSAAQDGTCWPVDAVYLLVADGERETPVVEQLSPADALSRLMAFRHMVGALDAPAHRRDFQTIAALTESAAIRELRRPHGLESASETVDAIVTDLEQLG